MGGGGTSSPFATAAQKVFASCLQPCVGQVSLLDTWMKERTRLKMLQKTHKPKRICATPLREGESGMG